MVTNSEITRLKEIEDEICELADEAYNIVRDTSEGGRSKAYWRGEVLGAMNGDTYAESTGSLHSVIEALEEEAEEDEEDEEDEE